MSEKTDHAHGLRGYKVHKCRCEVCIGGFMAYKAKRSLKNHKAAIKHYIIDGTPLVELYKKTYSRLDTPQRSLVKKWSTIGISVYDADKYSIKLGYHPYEIFGETYFEGLDEEIAQYKKVYGEDADV
jgi:hypothetical protein